MAEDKFTVGEAARKKWAKPTDGGTLSVDMFNGENGGVFSKYADLVLDDRVKPQTTVAASPLDVDEWKQDGEYIYLFVRGDSIMKIGGTRTSMQERWGSYLCGFHVPERGRSGKCSVTNAHLYHTIELGLINGEQWSVWCWKLPRVVHKVTILGDDVDIVVQTYHAYESVCIEKFKKTVGSIPVLCMNSDPSYKGKNDKKSTPPNY